MNETNSAVGAASCAARGAGAGLAAGVLQVVVGKAETTAVALSVSSTVGPATAGLCARLRER